MFKSGTKVHENKVRWIRSKAENVPPPTKGGKNEWISNVAEGVGRETTENNNIVPTYGDIEPPLDEDEKAAGLLPPDFATLP